MTPDFDPTRVDWNNPDVEYMMKHFKMATANRDDEIAALTKSNEELRRVYSELEAKYEALAGMYNRLTGKGGAAASGAPAGAGADDGRREDPARRRSYNVRKYQGYPRSPSPPHPPAPYADPPPPRGHVERRTATADDRFCRMCGDPLSAPTAEYGKVTEDAAGARWQVTHWTVTRRYCRRCGRQQSSQPDGVLPGEHYGIDVTSKVVTLRCMIDSFDKIRTIIGLFYGARIPQSTLNRLCDVVAARFGPLYGQMRAELVRHAAVGGDDTGWFVDGERRHVWVFVGHGAGAAPTVVFEITKSRGANVPAAVLGRYGGTILSDSHGAWNHVGGRHQKCLLHYFRDMYKTLERDGSSEFSLFFNRLYWILKDAISAAGLDDKAADCGAEAEILAPRVGELIGAEYEDADCRRYVKRLRRERGHLFTFLEHDVDYHNNISERGLRPFATSRKILYGNRSECGAERTKILMSVYETCKMRGVNFYQFTKDYLEGKTAEIPAGRKAAPAATAA